jgi:hypothetical protein
MYLGARVEVLKSHGNECIGLDQSFGLILSQ